jgi:hypothetical protein
MVITLYLTRLVPVTGWRRSGRSLLCDPGVGALAPRFVAEGFLSRPGGRQRGAEWAARGELPQMAIDGGIARHELPLIGVEEFEVLLSTKRCSSR